MKNFIRIIVLLAFLVNMGCSTDKKETPVKTDEAVVAAESWLKLVDDKNYGESWETSSAVFRQAISKEKWAESLTSVLTPFGKMTERKLLSANYSTELPGAPDGEYVVIQYQTKFMNKANAVETITPMKEADGEWRVSGYFIK